MPAQDPDTALLTAFQQGDPRAEKAVFDRYFQPLCLFSKRITGQLATSEDLVTDAYVNLMNRRADFEVLAQCKKYLYTSVYNASVNVTLAEQRHQAAHNQLRYLALQGNEPDDVLDNEILRAELLQEIYAEIENLPDRCRQIFKMIFVDGLPNETIAEKLSINTQTVRSQKARAIQLLRTSLLKKNRIPALLLLYALSSGISH